MSKIEIGRWSELLRRSLGQKGQETVASELSPEISATWQLESDTAEWQYLKAVRLIGAAAARSASAGNVARYALINPAASGMLAVVTHMSWSSVVTATMEIRLIQTALGNFATVEEAGPRDTRWRRGLATLVSPIIFSSEDGPLIAGGFRLYNTFILANTNAPYAEPVVLAPGSSLFWAGNILNVASRATINWQERRLPTLEL